jgi:hypothetical protein
MTAGITIRKCTVSILLSIMLKFISTAESINLPAHNMDSITIAVPADKITFSAISNSLKLGTNRNSSIKYKTEAIMMFNRCNFMFLGRLLWMSFSN